MAHRGVLMNNSEYFERCLQPPWTEASKSSVVFEDIEAKYLALFIGVAYSHSSIVPKQAPQSAQDPQVSAGSTLMRDFIEVYKLCDRFVCPRMAGYIIKCIQTAIMDGHRALFHTHHDVDLQRRTIRQFADAYEALEISHQTQEKLSHTLIEYFCEGVSYAAWKDSVDDVVEHPRFITSVSRGLAKKLAELQAGRKLKRKLLNAPDEW